MFSNLLLGVSIMPYEIYSWLRPTCQILMALIGIALTAVVLMQKGTNDNIGAIGGQETDTYAGKNKARSRDSILKKLTVIFGALMLIISLLFFVTYIEA